MNALSVCPSVCLSVHVDLRNHWTDFDNLGVKMILGSNAFECLSFRPPDHTPNGRGWGQKVIVDIIVVSECKWYGESEIGHHFSLGPPPAPGVRGWGQKVIVDIIVVFECKWYGESENGSHSALWLFRLKLPQMSQNAPNVSNYPKLPQIRHKTSECFAVMLYNCFRYFCTSVLAMVYCITFQR